MLSYTDRVLNLGLGAVIDNSASELALEDPTYIKEAEKETKLAERLEHVEIDKETRELMQEYISCKLRLNKRYSEISYIAGVKDIIGFMLQFDMIKGECRYLEILEKINGIRRESENN